MYAAAALATAVTTVASLAFTPASGISAPPAEPVRPYIVTAHDRADARALAGSGRWRVSRYYTAALPGFAAWLTDREAAELRVDARVRSLEFDQRVHTNGALNQPGDRWRVGETEDRPSAAEGARDRPAEPGDTPHRWLSKPGDTRDHSPSEPGNTSDTPDHSPSVAGDVRDRLHGRHSSGGAGARERVGRAGGRVTVYVIDSGVDVSHQRFGDRAWAAFDATGGTAIAGNTGDTRGPGSTDGTSGAGGGRGTGSAGGGCAGRGTLAAGVVAERAERARIASVRVLGCDGTGSMSDVLAGIDWVRRHAHGAAIANLSIGGVRSRAMDIALRRLLRSGVFVIETPQTAAMAAQYLESHKDASPSALASWLKSTATRAAIRQNPTRTPNLLPHSGGF